MPNLLNFNSTITAMHAHNKLWEAAYPMKDLSAQFASFYTPPNLGYIQALQTLSTHTSHAHRLEKMVTLLNAPADHLNRISKIASFNQFFTKDFNALIGPSHHFKYLNEMNTSFAKYAAFQTNEFLIRSLKTQDWEGLTSVEAFLDDVRDFIDSETTESAQEQQNRFAELWNRGNIIVKKYKLGLVISTFFFIYDKVPNFDYWKDLLFGPVNTTQAEISNMRQDIESGNQKLDSITVLLKKSIEDQKRYKAVLRDCSLRMYPKKKSLVFAKLVQGQTVILIDTSGIYAYVNYRGLDNNLPIAGWVNKKYLTALP